MKFAIVLRSSSHLQTVLKTHFRWRLRKWNKIMEITVNRISNAILSFFLSLSLSHSRSHFFLNTLIHTHTHKYRNTVTKQNDRTQLFPYPDQNSISTTTKNCTRCLVTEMEFVMVLAWNHALLQKLPTDKDGNIFYSAQLFYSI